MSVRRVDQGMARQAAALLPEQVPDELRTRYRQLRVMIHTSGLAATYAFVAAKGRSEGKGDLAQAYRSVAKGIRVHLDQVGLLPGGADMDDRRTLAALAGLDLRDYTRAAAETTALMNWLSRLADAVHQRAAREEDA